LSQSKWIDDDIRVALFLNINELFNFQRKYLIRINGTAELAWQDQNWGQHFLEAVSVHDYLWPLSDLFA
jgi:cell division control protein 24